MCMCSCVRGVYVYLSVCMDFMSSALSFCIQIGYMYILSLYANDIIVLFYHS